MDYKDLGTVEPLNESQELAWDGTIVAENEPKEYVLLPEGDYAFTVERFDKQRFVPKRPDSKVPECWAAVVHLKVYPHQSDAEPTVSSLCTGMETVGILPGNRAEEAW